MQIYRAGRIVSMAGEDIIDGIMLVREGRIVAALPLPSAVSDTEKPTSAEIKELAAPWLEPEETIQFYDHKDCWLLPGLIDSHCHAGIAEEIYSSEDDCNEITEPITPHMRAIDGVNHEDPAFGDALAAGITTVVIAPGSGNVIGGEMAALKTSGCCVDEMILKAPVGLKAAFGENPKQAFGGEQEKMPMTRMAIAGLLRENLAEAETYLRKQAAAKNDEDEDGPDRDLKLESIARVLKREIPLRVHAHRADDIMTALRISREFSVPLVIEHGTGAAAIAPYLASAGVPVVAGPLLVNRAKIEMKDVSMQIPGRLYQAGVKTALMTDHPCVPVQYLTLQAALAVREGLPEREALAMITCNAAEICGIADRVGSLEAGKDADFVIMNGPPFALTTKVQEVYIEGRQVWCSSKDRL